MTEETIDPEAMHRAPFGVPPAQARVYREAIRALARALVPHVIGGAHAMSSYTGHFRNTKDLDIFLEEGQVVAARRALEAAGFETELRDPCWLAKARKETHWVDLIFAAGNLVARVDGKWLDRGRAGRVFGVRTLLASPEDLVSWKAFICERHRFDGADIAHILHSLEGRIDWDYLLERMGEHWELLLWHLVFFQYVYPADRSFVPRRLMAELMRRHAALQDEPGAAERPKPFRGTLLSLFSFQRDVARGYRDLRSELRRMAAA